MTNKTYARVQEGVVAEIVVLDAALQIGVDVFHADIANQFIDVTSLSPLPRQGWTYAAGAFSPAAPVPAAVVAASLSGYASLKQAAVLEAGITVNVAASGPAVNVLCDGTNATRADLALLALFGQASPTGTKTWIDNNGVVSVLTGAQLVALATAIGDWVSNTYSALAGIIGQIVAGSITLTSQVDAQTWPTS